MRNMRSEPRNDPDPSGLVRRDDRRVLPAWLDPLSLSAGVAIGAVGWAWALPALRALAAETTGTSFAVSGVLLATGLAFAGARMVHARTPFASFRMPPASATGLARARPVAEEARPPLDIAGWIAKRMPDAGGSRPEVRRHALSDILSEQLTVRETALVEALTDALLAIGSGHFGLRILDDLAVLATRPPPAGEAGRDDPVPEGLSAFREGLREWWLPPLRRTLADEHGFSETRLLGALARARAVEIVPTADFAWLSRHRRPLWLAACSLGATGTVPDALGILAHYRAERAAGGHLLVPEVSTAVDAILDRCRREGQTDEPPEADEAWVAAADIPDAGP